MENEEEEEESEASSSSFSDDDSASNQTRSTNEKSNAVDSSFWGKLRRAYRIFFPPSERDSARAEAKKRLRMILVADRCTMSDDAMEEMKKKIVKVCEEYVEVDEDVPVEVRVKDDERYGTAYGITVPVSKVKAEYDAENDAYMMGAQFVYDDETWEDLEKDDGDTDDE